MTAACMQFESWLCVPVFRRVCLYRRNGNKVPSTLEPGNQISPGQQRLFTRFFSSAIILLGSPACDFRPYALSQGRRNYIERLSVFYLSFMQTCSCKVSRINVLSIPNGDFPGLGTRVWVEDFVFSAQNKSITHLMQFNPEGMTWVLRAMTPLRGWYC
jgi:hypothetical protein